MESVCAATPLLGIEGAADRCRLAASELGVEASLRLELLDVLDPEQPFSPRVSSKRLPDGRMVTAPLEDMFPFLPREEFLANMVVPTVPEA